MSPGNEGRKFGNLAAWSLALLLGLYACASFAAQERYDYDGLGRLIRVIDEQGRVTEYVYDAAGNILQVIGSTGGAQALSITSISPAALRRGEIKTVTITGTGLIGARVTESDPGLAIANLRGTSSQITFDLTASVSAELGVRPLTVANASGSVATTITINPVLPVLGMSPLPIAIVAGAPARSFLVTLSNADNIDHTVSVISADPAIATVTPPSITIPGGQTEFSVSVTGQAVGTTAINLSSAALVAASIPVGVGSVLVGDAMSVSQPLSVYLPALIPGTPNGNSMSSTNAVSVYFPALIPGAPNGNSMSATNAVSVYFPALISGTPNGNSMSATNAVSVHVPASIPGAPPGSALSVTQPVSISVP